MEGSPAVSPGGAHRDPTAVITVEPPMNEAVRDTDVSNERAPLKGEVGAESYGWRSELAVQWRIGGLAATSIMLRIAAPTIDVAFLGHLGTDELAAGSVAGIWVTATSFFFDRGLIAAAQTLCAQAFGAGNYELVAKWLQLSLVVSVLLCIPVLLLWMFPKPMLELVGVSDHQAELGQTFTRYYSLSLVPYVVYNAIESYLQAQEIVTPGLICTFLAVLLNVFLNYLLVFGLFGWSGLGFIGSPLATTFSAVFKLALYGGYIWWGGLHKKCWVPWSRETFTRERIYEYVVRNGLGSALAALFEEYQMLVVGLMAVHLGKPDLAAHNAMLNIFALLTSVVYGFMTALTVRTGRHLGAGSPDLAKQAAVTGTSLLCCIAVVVAILFATLRDQVGRVFSSDPEVLHFTRQLSLLCAVCYPVLSAFFSGVAVLAAQCKYAAPGIAFFVGGWCVTLPVAYVLGFHWKK
eukprot:Hpha_TRINITY_DN30296_c0_g1::TRINITY_DN30296_c0_g1_i1::g.27157::m.27157/K03327/TC.MATE, SLC47A, norM, mdtK, dinF; multidrug resistance protein, MATE family